MHTHVGPVIVFPARVVAGEPTIVGGLEIVVPMGMGKIEMRSESRRHPDDVAAVAINSDKLALGEETNVVYEMSFGEKFGGRQVGEAESL